jgi:hypothetical protein
MKALALIALLACGSAYAQNPEKKDEPAKAEEQKPRPLILRIDQLPPSERSGLVVTEEAKKPRDDLPDLGGKPSSAYDAAGVRGSGTSAPGSPYPADTQMPGK